MTRILFWNINARPLEQWVAKAADEYQADIVVVCEHGNRIAEIEMALSQEASGRHASHIRSILAKNKSIAVFSMLQTGWLTVVTEHSHCMVHALARPGKLELLIASVHLPSPMHQTESDLLLLASDSAGLIRDIESQRKHRQTVVVGDFNMDPYHKGMVASHAFHAVMDQKIAKRESRAVQGVEHFFFYNPMWSRLGDHSPGPPGTYYNAKASPECHFWHAWDQVLVRPGLLDNFNVSNLSVITRIARESLLNKRGLPASRFSDHLPICFEV